MTDRESDAIREAMNAIRSDFGTVAKILTHMTRRGYSAEETQAAINAIAARNTTHKDVPMIEEEEG